MDVVQPSLFDVEEFDPGPAVPGLAAGGTRPGTRPLDAMERTELGDGAWIEVRRQWVAGPMTLFERLLASVPWRSERRRMYDRTVDVPRLLAFYDQGVALPDPVLREARDTLNDYYRRTGEPPLTTTGVCLYRNGGDSVAWHGDTIGRRSAGNTVVAVVSLGQERRFLLRSISHRSSLSLTVGHGDLLVMGGSCQRTWQHAVPKTARPVGPRISVQFRSAGVR
jgi:alkylated DNA repair dioxygenase AlkB